LSGTSLENHLGELWSLHALVFPSLLGSWTSFRERFATANTALRSSIDSWFDSRSPPRQRI
jgi:SNF2 family DNA or RNA helicase